MSPSWRAPLTGTSVRNDVVRTVSDMPRAALVLHGTAMLYEVAIAAEILGVDRSELSSTGSWYDLVVCTPDGAPHPWVPHLRTATYAEIVRVDTVVVPSTEDLEGRPDEAL